MDLSEPARALAQGLTMPVLRALHVRTKPATAAQVQRAAGAGTLAGIQRACERLAEHGLVLRDEMGGRVVYEINDHHVLYPAVQPLLQAKDAVPRLLRDLIGGWEAQPVTAALFGSAARRDGDLGSDIDLLLVRPSAREVTAAVWAAQVRNLARDVHTATGNRVQAVVYTSAAFRLLLRSGDPLVRRWRAEAIPVGGTDVHDLIGDGL